MTLNIGTDWEDSSRAKWNRAHMVRQSVQTCVEERWFRCLNDHIQPYQKLDSLSINLLEWRDPTRRNPHIYHAWMMQLPEDTNTINKWRKAIFHLCKDYICGIKTVIIENRDDDDLGMKDNLREYLALRMQRPKQFELPARQPLSGARLWAYIDRRNRGNQ